MGKEKSFGNLIMAAKVEAKRQEQTRAAQMLLDMKGDAKGKWADMIKSMKAETSHMEEMRKERRYLDLVKYIVFSAIKYVKTKIKAFWKGLRKEHAIISFLYPLDDETTVVTDPQVAQIFWNIAFYLIMCWFTYTYAILFGPEETNGWLMSFVLASGQAWLIIEPFEVVLLVALPFLFDNKCVANCRETAKELGLL